MMLNAGFQHSKGFTKGEITHYIETEEVEPRSHTKWLTLPVLDGTE